VEIAECILGFDDPTVLKEPGEALIRDGEIEKGVGEIMVIIMG
jgi:hypothetical protein